MGVIRRVVTGNNAQGRSCIVSDERVGRGELWRSGPGLDADAGAPATILASTAPQLEPVARGHGAFFVSFPPWSKVEAAYVQGQNPGFDSQGFHRTATIDYLYIVQGELELLLDDGGTVLHAGDLVIQRNTRHAWRNNGDGAVAAFAVMIKLDNPG